jgi:hypothetical protein
MFFYYRFACKLESMYSVYVCFERNDVSMSDQSGIDSKSKEKAGL